MAAAVKRSVSHEQFYTDPALARRCVALVDDTVGLDRFALVVEPSAGEGAFLHELPAERRIGIDVDPREPSVVAADFLQWQPPEVDGPVLTIGNPPFGQRGALAMAFLDRACAYSDAVAFILPRSFNKYTFTDRVHPRFHLAGSLPCEEDFHDAHGRPVTVRTVFQVWQRQPVDRPREVRPDRHPDFEMRHAHLSRLTPEKLHRMRQEHEFTVPQVGADFRPRDVHTVVRGSHWFIRPLVPGVRERFERLDFGFLAGMNTAHTSLSKRDIVAAYVAAGPGVSRPRPHGPRGHGHPARCGR